MQVSHRTKSFAGFSLDLTRGCLLRGTAEVKLRPKPFDALKYLVENPGRLISKAELIKALWPDTAVTDDSLVQCLMEVRRALGDEAQQIIKTVPRRGYIFDKEVTDNGSPATITYTEETEGVQVIIEEEEETNRHGTLKEHGWPAAPDAALLPAFKANRFERVTAAIKRRKGAVALGVFTIVAAVAAIVYFTRPGEAIDSVAVMPFVNVSGDPNTEYLTDGLTDDVISSLSQLPNLKVIAFSGVLRYKGRQTEPQAVGHELNVRAVLMSRLVQRGDDLAISTELVDVRDNHVLWRQQYNRKLSEILTVKTEIAQNISSGLRLRLSGQDKERLTKRYTDNGEAYQLYMMGRYYFRRKGKAGLEKGAEYFEQAIKKDPSYAPAYVGLGETYRVLSWGGWTPAKEARQKEELSTLKALQIDDALAEAHVLMANIKEIGLDWPGAEDEYKRALELDPNSVRAHNTYAWHLEMFGRFDEALSHLKRAQEIDPFELEVLMDIATNFSFSRQPDRALEQYQKVMDMDPTFPLQGRLAETYQEKGMYEEAIAALKKANVSGAQLGYAYALAGRRDEAQKILDQLRDEQAKGLNVSPFNFALLYMGLGEKDQAFEWFNKTFEENPYRISFLNVNPRFDSLRSDPRFALLMRRMKLVP